MSSIIFNYNGTDKTLILDTRASLLQQFVAVNWTDLRLSMMISICKQSDPTDPTGLAETIGAGEDNNQLYVGFKQSDGLLPPATNFFGFSTQKSVPDSTTTQLIDNVNLAGSYGFQRTSNLAGFFFVGNGTTKQVGGAGTASFPTQDSVQALYATLIILRMQRNDPTLSLVTSLSSVFTGTSPWTGAYNSDTSISNIRTLTAAAAYTQVAGPFTFGSVPDSIYAYWPFQNSRLRIHSYVLEKYA